MAKTKQIRILLDEQHARELAELAKYEHKPVGVLAQELIAEVLDDCEDRCLSIIAEDRDTKTAKKMRHAVVWK